MSDDNQENQNEKSKKDTSKSPWGESNQPNRKKEDQPWNRNTQRTTIMNRIIDELNNFCKDIFGWEFKKKNNGFNGNNPPPNKNKFVWLAPVVIAGLWLMQGFYRVQEGEVAVVLHFGKLDHHDGPGLHFYWPYPFGQVIIQDVSSINRIDGTTSAEDTSLHSMNAQHNPNMPLILTGDENMVSANYTVIWKIKDVDQFLFTARNPAITIKAAAESAICEVIGQTNARSALTEGREVIGQKIQEVLQRLMDTYKLGVQIISIQLQKVDPPHPVLQAFNDVQASLLDADRARNEAEAYKSDLLPRARGEVARITQQSEGKVEAILASAQADAQRFLEIAKSVAENKDIAETRYYIETLRSIFEQQAPKMIIDSKFEKAVIPYLMQPSFSPPSMQPQSDKGQPQAQTQDQKQVDFSQEKRDINALLREASKLLKTQGRS